MSRRRKDYLWPIALAGVAVAAGYYIYTNVLGTEGENSNTTKAKAQQQKVSRAAKITLVASKALVEQGVPLQVILERFPNITIVVCPNVDEAASAQLHSQISEEHSFKVLPCETDIGVTHIIKHLRPDQVVLSSDSPVVTSDIERFVGSIVRLSDDAATASSQMHDIFFN